MKMLKMLVNWQGNGHTQTHTRQAGLLQLTASTDKEAVSDEAEWLVSVDVCSNHVVDCGIEPSVLQHKQLTSR